ncbi:ankyrin repeat protein, putative [Trichomonas vaginalis G3]|uniref:Ankyrin repeat protein, putative n=1 Tax=Trichomonas vaginalis (strain ATCC PRA-98 / G3) TaxID=412133 RepID=A2DN85_TRIV3|nr:protein ubiquitination [Trichomonas vaginalis G3]EAY18073.1 ankyrin repeat protein, putative [Trichomonas vaginalis G3]KAI5492348.1 protein ubiquitination [Trichomonas vaginalis G3]|eukprot:XP_001579059.1 ankyrin repeat protein [Trichomonas vaginalis G3]
MRYYSIDIECFYNAIGSHNNEFAKFLISNAANVEALCDGKTLLHVAVENDCIETAEILLANGININDSTSEEDCTQIYFAVCNRNKKMVEILISHGADLNLEMTSKTNLLQKTIELYEPAILDILLTHGADINVTDDNLNSLLHIAAISNYKTIAEILIKHNINN